LEVRRKQSEKKKNEEEKELLYTEEGKKTFYPLPTEMIGKVLLFREGKKRESKATSMTPSKRW